MKQGWIVLVFILASIFIIACSTAITPGNQKVKRQKLTEYLSGLPEEAFSCQTANDCVMINICCGGIFTAVNKDYIFEINCEDYQCPYYTEMYPPKLNCENSRCQISYGP